MLTVHTPPVFHFQSMVVTDQTQDFCWFSLEDLFSPLFGMRLSGFSCSNTSLRYLYLHSKLVLYQWVLFKNAALLISGHTFYPQLYTFIKSFVTALYIPSLSQILLQHPPMKHLFEDGNLITGPLSPVEEFFSSSSCRWFHSPIQTFYRSVHLNLQQ